MSEPHRNILSVERIHRSAFSAGVDSEELLAASKADAVLLEWNDRASHARESIGGLFAVLGAAARRQRVIFPARWLPVEVDGAQAKLLAFARSDGALRRLFGASDADLVGRGLSRPDEPLLLLGIEGDALLDAASPDAAGLRRRAEQWIQRLGADRIVLAVPSDAGPQHPLVELAGQRALPVFRVGAVGRARAGGEVSADLPLLWTDFQLDTEHRLPDDSCIPGLRDLLHRGALLRERTLYDRLPVEWRTRVDAELRALYAWHVSPLLRRVTAGLQLLEAVDGVRVAAPLPHLRSVTAWLLGLTDQRPHPGVLAAEDPVQSARRLATALQEFDRTLRLQVGAEDWPRLHARMATWAEGGFLARAEDLQDGRLHFCFSGQALTRRAPLRRGVDGIDLVQLDARDLRELGWLHIECAVEETARQSLPSPSSSAPEPAERAGDSGPRASVLPGPDRAQQLALGLGTDPFRQERTA